MFGMGAAVWHRRNQAQPLPDPPPFGPTLAYNFSTGSLAPVAGDTPLLFNRASTGLAYRDGNVHEHAVDEPRFGDLGLYVEGFAVNGVLWSQDLERSPWTGGATVDKQAWDGPSSGGVLDADRLADNSTGVTQGRVQALDPDSFVRDEIHGGDESGLFPRQAHFGVFVERHDRGGFAAIELDNGTSSQLVVLDPGNGQVTSGFAAVRPFDSAWLVTIAAFVDTDAPLRVGLYPAWNGSGGPDADPSATGQTGFWGVHVQPGIRVQTYVPSFSSPGVREPDYARTLDSLWHEQSAGTFYARGWFEAGGFLRRGMLCLSSQDVLQESTQLYFTGDQEFAWYTRQGSSTPHNHRTASTPAPADAIHRLATNYDVSADPATRLVQNGVEKVGGVGTGEPPLLAQAEVGPLYVGLLDPNRGQFGAFFNGEMIEVAYYDTDIGTASTEALTDPSRQP